MPLYSPALDLILNLADKSAVGRLALLGSRVVSSPSSSSSRIVRADTGLCRVRGVTPNLAGERAFDDVDLSISTVRIALGVPGSNPYCLATLSTPFPVAAAQITTPQSATSDLPATKRITLDPTPYAGHLIITLDALAPFEIPFDAEADQIKSLAGTAYKVRKRAANVWEISGTEPGQDVAITVDVSGLVVPLGLSGAIALNTVALAAAFTAAASGTPPSAPKWLRVTLEVEIDGVKVYQNDNVQIARELINLSTLVPAPIPPSDFATLSGLIGAKQPIDADLTAIAALATTAWGRALLALTDAGALRTYASLQPLNSGLSSISSLPTASYGRALLTQPDAPSLRTYLSFNPAGDLRWVQLANLNSLGDARWSALGHTHAQSEVIGLLSDLSTLNSQLSTKAPLASPALTGTPTAPTAANATSNTQLATTGFVHALFTDLVNASPATLDTLKELADAIGDDPNFAVTVANSVATKLAKASNLSDLTDAAAARTNLGLATVAASGLFADLGGKPTTITGYGITDLNSLGDARWVQLANLNSLGDSRWSLLGHTHAFASLTSVPALARTDLANAFILLQTFNALASSSIVASQLANPGTPTVTPVGVPGATTWSYKIVAKLSDGTPSAAGAAGTTTTGNATLDSSNKNSLSWTAVTGAASYDVYRTVAGLVPTTLGKIANVLTNAYVDAGAAGDGSTAPATNATGSFTGVSMSLSGPFTGGAVSSTTFSGPGDAITVLPGPTSRTLQAKLRDSVSLKDFGGIGDNSTNNDAAFTAALASSYPVIHIPEGTYLTALTEAQLAGKRFTGPGFIKGAAGAYPDYQGPANFTRLNTRPSNGGESLSAGNYSFVDGEKFVLEANSRQALDSAYYEYSTTPHFTEANFRSGGSGFTTYVAARANPGDTVVTVGAVDEISVGDTVDFYSGLIGATNRRTITAVNTGTKQLTLNTALGSIPNDVGYYVANRDWILKYARTMNQVYYSQMHHAAGGDAYIYGGRVFAYREIPAGAQSSFQFNSTAGFLGGDVNAAANGVFLTPFEFAVNDNNHDVAVIGGLMNLNRSKGPYIDFFTGIADPTQGKYGGMWVGYEVTSNGRQPADAGYLLGGYFHVGIDLVPATYNDGCAIGLAAGQKIFFNNSASGTRGILLGDVLGDMTLGYSSSTATVDFKKGSNTVFSVSATGVSVNGRADFKGYLTGTFVLDFPSTAPQSSSPISVSVPGAVDGDVVVLGVPTAADPGGSWKGIVTSSGVVTIVYQNFTAGTLNPASGTFRVAVLKF